MRELIFGMAIGYQHWWVLPEMMRCFNIPPGCTEFTFGVNSQVIADTLCPLAPEYLLVRVPSGKS